MQTDTNILTDGEKKMLNALPWPAIVLDDQGMITDTNEEWQNAVKQTGWLFPDSNSDNYFDHCANYVEQGNDYALRLIFTIREVLDGVHQKKELTILSDESSGKKWCQISISSLQKRRPAALLVFTNVTSNRNAQAALRESEEKYSKLLDTFPEKSPERIVSHTLDDESRFSQIVLNNIPGIFLVIDENLSVVQWNNILRHELGYTPEELNQINIIDLFEKSAKAWVRNVLHNIFKTGAGNFIASIHSRRDEVRPYHLYFNKFENEDQLFLVATAVDKTDHLEAESEKERNFELTSQLFENSPLAKVMIEPNGRVSKANRGFRDLFGYTEKEIMGQDVNQLIATGKHILEADEINNQAFKGRSHQQKTVRQNKDKEQIPGILNTVPILHEEEVIAVFGI